jgi:hypothetical protein
MIDKKTLLFIGVLAVVAIIVLAVGLIAPSLGNTSGSSFSALFDKMVEKVSGEKQLVLPNGTYAADQTIKVTDKIIAIASPNAQSTTLYFLYQGATWVDEEDGTSFDVLTDNGHISVDSAMFHLHFNTDLSVALDIGDSITLQVHTELSDGRIVLGHDWAVVEI